MTYDIVVLDVGLPDVDGFTVCRAMRERAVWSPVLMLTARTAVADRVDGLDAGADDYLGKPFAVEELLARVRALARRGPVARPPVLEAGSPRPRSKCLEGTDLGLAPVQGQSLKHNAIISIVGPSAKGLWRTVPALRPPSPTRPTTVEAQSCPLFGPPAPSNGAVEPKRSGIMIRRSQVRACLRHEMPANLRFFAHPPRREHADSGAAVS
jgi:hypothetical protein